MKLELAIAENKDKDKKKKLIRPLKKNECSIFKNKLKDLGKTVWKKNRKQANKNINNFVLETS